MALLGLLNLSHSQPGWPQNSGSRGGHYNSGLGLEMTSVTDDIRKSHLPRWGLSNLVELLLLLPSLSLNYCSQNQFGAVQIKGRQHSQLEI